MARALVHGLSALLLVGLSSAPAHAVRYVVPIRNMAFGQAPALLRVGDTILWQNKDMFQHTVTARSGEFDLDLPPGKEGQISLTREGKLDIYCRYHPTMTVSLTVRSRGGAKEGSSR
jgi:plastocyanin